MSQNGPCSTVIAAPAQTPRTAAGSIGAPAAAASLPSPGSRSEPRPTSPSFGTGCTPGSYLNSVSRLRITLRTVGARHRRQRPHDLLDGPLLLEIGATYPRRSGHAIIPARPSDHHGKKEVDTDTTQRGVTIGRENRPQGSLLRREFTYKDLQRAAAAIAIKVILTLPPHTRNDFCAFGARLQSDLALM